MEGVGFFASLSDFSAEHGMHRPRSAHGASSDSASEISSPSPASIDSPASDALTVLHSSDLEDDDGGDGARTKLLQAALSIAEQAISERDATVSRLTVELQERQCAQELERLDMTASAVAEIRERDATVTLQVAALAELRSEIEQVQRDREQERLESKAAVEAATQGQVANIARLLAEVEELRGTQETERLEAMHCANECKALRSQVASSQAIAQAAAAGLEAAKVRETETVEELHNTRVACEVALSSAAQAADAKCAEVEEAAAEALAAAQLGAQRQLEAAKVAHGTELGKVQEELAALVVGRVISHIEIDESRRALSRVQAALEAAHEEAAAERQAATAREVQAAGQLSEAREEAAKEAAAWQEALEQSEAERLAAKQAAREAEARGEALILKLAGAKQAAMKLAAGLEEN